MWKKKGTENQSTANQQCDFFKTVQKSAQIYQVSLRGEEVSTFAAERSLDPWELDCLM